MLNEAHTIKFSATKNSNRHKSTYSLTKTYLCKHEWIC